MQIKNNFNWKWNQRKIKCCIYGRYHEGQLSTKKPENLTQKPKKAEITLNQNKIKMYQNTNQTLYAVFGSVLGTFWCDFV